MKRPTNRATCRKCGARAADVGMMSHTGQCPTCGSAAIIENVLSLKAHAGEPFLRWRRGMAASVGAMTIDDLLEDSQEG